MSKDSKIQPDLTVPEAMAAINAIGLPQQYPKPAYLHGFVSFIVLVPSMIHPSEWIEVLHENMDDFPLSMEHSRAISSAILKLYNSLNQAVATDEIALPATDWESSQLWSQGFALAMDNFKHLWEIFLAEVEEAQSESGEKLAAQTALSNELWQKLTTTWVGLMAPANDKILGELCKAESFKNMDDTQLKDALAQDCNAGLRFLTSITQNMLRVREALRARKKKN